MGMAYFGLRSLNLSWSLLSIYFVSGTVPGTFFAFSQRLIPALERQRFGFKSHKAIYLPQASSSLWNATHFGASWSQLWKLETSKHMGIKIPLGWGSNEPDPVTLLGLNSLPSSPTVNVLVAATITPCTKARTMVLHILEIHLLYLALGFQNEKPWGGWAGGVRINWEETRHSWFGWLPTQPPSWLAV